MEHDVALPSTPRAGDAAPEPTYVEGLRGRPKAWRTVTAIAAAVLALVAALALVLPLGALIDQLSGAEPVGFDDFRLTPGTWLAGAIGIALFVPWARLVQRVVYGVPGRWLSSVEGRFRWRWVGRAAIVVVPTFLLVTALLAVVAPWRPWQVAHVPLALAALVVTPLQAAGEEWLFRGLVGRALAAPFARRAVSLVVSAAGSSMLFWLGHGTLEPFAVAYYLAAGVGFWLTAEWTGGLEAGTVMHACANTFLVVPAVLGGGLAGASALHGPILVAPALVWLLLPVLLRALVRRCGIRTTGALPRADRRGYRDGAR